MTGKIEITIDVIVHATEDLSKIFLAFEDVFGVTQDDFAIKETVGHYENVITILYATIKKKKAENFVSKLLEMLPAWQIDELINEIEERTVDSRFHMRLDKHELIKGNLAVKEGDTIQLKIHTPIYNKKDIVKRFTEIFTVTQLD